MSIARQRLKSPQSLCGTSTHPTTVTHRSQSWSWMIDSHPFRSMSVSPPNPQIRLFQTLILKLKGQGHGCGQRARPFLSPVSIWHAFCLFHINQMTIPAIQLFWNLTLKIKCQGHGWGESSRSHSLPSIQSIHIIFVSHQSDQPFLIYPTENIKSISCVLMLSELALSFFYAASYYLCSDAKRARRISFYFFHVGSYVHVSYKRYVQERSRFYQDLSFFLITLMLWWLDEYSLEFATHPKIRIFPEVLW